MAIAAKGSRRGINLPVFFCLVGECLNASFLPIALRTKGGFVFAKKRDVWAHPVICEGRLYLRCRDELSCYDIRAKAE